MNINNYYQEWDIDKLPWDCVTPVLPGEVHPDGLSQRLVDAINDRVLGPPDMMPSKARTASLAFLYLYMTLHHGDGPK